jgi:hypothetical protein
MAYLVSSLRALFTEINDTWPNRDHGTDGWIGDKKHCPGSSDHCADSSGRVHAIDIDKDGIDPYLVIARLSNYKGVIRYMNYNYKQYHVKNNYEARNLGGDNPHTGHIHVSIEHTDHARNYTDGYGILTWDLPLIPPLDSFRDVPTDDFSYAWHALQIGYDFGSQGNAADEYASIAWQIRIPR